MPTYDYKCPTCKNVEVITHSMTDENKQKCTKDGSEMYKILAATPAHFRGDGFYTTDKFTDR